MIKGLLMRFAYAAEVATLKREIDHLIKLRDAALDEANTARAEAKAANVGYDNLVDHYNDMRLERDQLRARLDALQPTPTEAVWMPEPGDMVTGEALPLGIEITGRFMRWHESGPFAVIEGNRRVYTRSLRPADTGP